MLILGLAIFGVGMYIATEVFTKAYDQARVLDNDIKFAIENDLRDISEEVSIGLHRRQAERKETGGFGVGIANRETTDNIYIINSVYANVYEGSGAGGDKITFPTIGTELAEVSLKPHEVKIINVPFYVTPDAQDGTYVYNLEVTKQACTGNCRIGKLQKLYLEVK